MSDRYSEGYDDGYDDGESSIWADIMMYLDEYGEEKFLAWVKQRLEERG